jgi:hypothetical protein
MRTGISYDMFCDNHRINFHFSDVTPSWKVGVKGYAFVEMHTSGKNGMSMRAVEGYDNASRQVMHYFTNEQAIALRDFLNKLYPVAPADAKNFCVNGMI